MNELGKFGEFALRGEVTTPGGWLNMALVVVGAMLITGAESGNLLMQLWELAFRVLDRLLHFVEKFFEFVAALARADFTASPKPTGYAAPREEGKHRVALFALLLIGLACTFGLAGARYSPAKAASNAAASEGLAAPSR